MFWLHEEELPPGAGHEPFCPGHLIYLAVFLTLSFGYALLYKRLDARRRKRADRALSLALFFFALCEYGVTALLGHFSRYTLPLHVCSLMFLLAPWHARTRSPKLRRVLGALLFHPGLLGTLAALLFPDWLCYPFWNYMSISGFLAHGLLLVYGASVLVGLAEEDQPTLIRRDLRSSLLFLGLGAAVMSLVNRALGTNYWFLAWPSADSPFLAVWQRAGRSGYLPAFALCAGAVTALWYGLRLLLAVGTRRHNA